MTDPPPDLRISGMANLVPRNTPVLFTAITLSHSARVTSSTRLLTPPIPALLTRMSSLPKRSVVTAMASCQLPSLVTSR